MVQIPLIKMPSISNIVRGEDATHLFDGDFSTTYNPTYPSWQSMLNPVITDILADTKTTLCIPRQLKFVQQSADNLGTKMYFINKATKEKVLIYTFAGTGGYQPNSYQIFDIPVAQQFDVSRIIFEATGGGPSYPAEIQLWGDFTEKQIVLKSRSVTPAINLLGFVCYPWNTALAMWPSTKDTFTSLKPKRIRVYDDYGNVFENGSVNLHWDQFNQYSTLKGMGVDVKDCIQNHPGYPYPLGDIRLDPATYLAFARDLQKYAIANKAAGSPAKEIGIENELDRSWSGVEKYMDGYALAALSSACFDGHKGKYQDAGIKQIDPTIKVVSPGCATDRTQILHQMRIWCEENRGYRADGSVDFPFDAYEFHWYQSVGGQYAGKPGGMPPEIVIDRVQEIVDFFREYAPWMQINIGEYGLDFNADSDLNAPAYGKYTAQQTRGNWFVRDLMMFAKVGINAAEWYRETMDWVDDPSDPTGQTNIYDKSGQFFDTMDLITPNHYAQPATYKRRTVGDYFRQLADVLSQGFVFDSVVSTSPYVFKFKKADGVNLYALWTLETITWPLAARTSSRAQDEAAVERWKEMMANKYKSKPPKPKDVTSARMSVARATITENTFQYNINVKGQLLRFVEGADSMSSEAFNGGMVTVESKPILILGSTSATTGKSVYHKGGFVSSPGVIQNYAMYTDKSYDLTGTSQQPSKVIYHKGGFALSTGKIQYYVMYTDGTYILTDSSYKPL